MTIRVILANDHQILLEALGVLLENEADIDVVGVNADGLAVHNLSATLHPDVVVMGIGKHAPDSIDATRQLTADYPEIRIIALATLPQREHAISMLDAGASTYVIKEDHGAELVCALHAVTEHRTCTF